MAENHSPTTETLADRVAVVIGGGRGIGRATARKLAAAGASVIVAARTETELESVVAEIQSGGGHALARRVDVTRWDTVQSLAAFARDGFGRVDVLVNSAGASLIAPLEATTQADWDHILNTNLKGPFLCIQAMLDLLRASDRGQVINIASKVGLSGHKLVSAYAAAKAGLIGLSRSLAHELADENIRIQVLCPGPVDTPMRWKATPQMDPSLAISAEAVAETILFLVTMDSHVSTNEIVVEATAYDEKAISLER